MKTYKQFVAEANKSREIQEGWGAAANWALRAVSAYGVYDKLTRKGDDGKSKPDVPGAVLDTVGAVNPLARGANVLRGVSSGAFTASGLRDMGIDKPIKDAVRPHVKRIKGPEAKTPGWLKQIIPDIPGKSYAERRYGY